MLSQQHISPQTPTGATLRTDGATFRVWAPQAAAVYLHGSFGGQVFDQLTGDRLLQKDERGYWTGYQDGARPGECKPVPQFIPGGATARRLERLVSCVSPEFE